MHNIMFVNNKIKKINLALFLTYGVSLKEWARIGILKREIALYNKLAEKIKHIYFFTYGDKQDLSYKHLLADNITIVLKPFKISNKIYSLILPFIHRKILKECDILKTNQMDGAWTAVLSKLLFRNKLIVRTGYCWSITLKHLNKKSRYYLARIIEKIAYTFADFSIVTSQRDADYVIKNYSINKVQLIPNYINTELFRPLKTKKKKNEICFVGRFSKEKNILMLIDALKETSIKLNLIGDGAEKQTIIDFAKQNKVKIKLHGTIPNNDLPKLLNQFEIFVLPSQFEGNPKALLEAMACGLCCIGTNVEGIKEVIRNGENGILCEKNVNSLHTAILLALRNHKLRKQLGQNAADDIHKNYSLDKIAETEWQIITHTIILK